MNFVKFNINIHNKIFKKYEKTHFEIFNEVEQARLGCAISRALSFLDKKPQCEIKALDFGCGSGNITRHFINLGLNVTAADVSVNFLKLVQQKYPTKNINFLLLNGRNLNNLEDNYYDIIAIYSVLHHVEDYLKLIKELSQKLNKKGILYIDHEVTEGFWQPSELYLQFKSLVEPRKNYLNQSLNILRPSWYVTKLKKIFNPRYQPEGDIHVWPDDHIEWDKIKIILNDLGMEVKLEQDYLLFKDYYDSIVYNHFKNTCSDMKVLIAKKLT